MRRLLIILFAFTCSTILAQMTPQKMDSLIHSIADDVEGQSPVWEIEILDRLMMVVTDPSSNRMRIIAPITKSEELTPEQVQKCMVANFHSALDVRYAFSEGVLWSAYIHPYRELTEDQFIDGIIQTLRAALTFGTTYNSTDMIFGPSTIPDSIPTQPEEEEKPFIRRI